MLKAKPTMATLKSFVRKNRDVLLFRQLSRFDGMVDGVRGSEDKSWGPALRPEGDKFPERNLGIAGAWCVGSSRDYIRPFTSPGLAGYHVYNCCGSFEVAVPITGE